MEQQPTLDAVLEPVTVFGSFQTHQLIEPARSTFLDQISQLWSPLIGTQKDRRRFPGPNPCSIEKSDFPILQQHKYKICEKTDGYRCLLVVCVFQGYQLVTLVTRAWDVYVIPLQRCPKQWYQGTVLDGELITIRGEWVWLGFDGIMVAGVPLYHDPLEDRLQAVRQSMRWYTHTPGEVRLSMKPYFDTVEQYTCYKQSTDHAIDGVILTPSALGIQAGRHPSLFKLKDSGHHTVDFLYKNDGLHVFDPSRKNHVCVARMGDMTLDIPPGSIIECSYTANNTWRFHHIRHDKKTANDMLTYEKTMVNIKENLQLPDVSTMLT